MDKLEPIIPLSVLISVCVSGVLYLYFKLFMDRTARLSTNRIVLPILFLSAVSAPLLANLWRESSQVAARWLPEVTVDPNTPVIAPEVRASVAWTDIYLIGILIFCALFIVKFVASMRYKKPQTGFTFLNRIHVNPDLPPAVKVAVRAHEQAHKRLGHNWEILLWELMRVFFWYNPFIHLIIPLVKQNHEFQADRNAASQHPDYDKILVSQHFNIDPILLGHAFNKSNLQKRLIMINTKTKRADWLKYAVFVLLVGASVTLTSWRFERPAQTEPATTQVEEEPDVNAEFPGGMEGLMTYMVEHINYPKSMQKAGKSGTVYVGFIIDTDGKVIDAQVKKGAEQELDDEALRVIESMPPWKPATKDGKPVKQEMVLPVKFKLED